MTGRKLLNSQKLAERLRERSFDRQAKKIRMTKFPGSDQATDLSLPPNCRVGGGIRRRIKPERRLVVKLDELLFSDPFTSTVYGERFLNDSKGRFEDYSEVDPRYDPQGNISHIDVPYTILSPERCVLLQSFPSSELVDWIGHPFVFRGFFLQC